MRFEELHAAIGDRVRAHWPDTERAEASGMDAYLVPIQDAPAAEDWKGTMPRDRFVVAPTQRKAGITVHLWHPKRPDLLQANADWLQEAGFRPMVGCLQWNRKADFPLDAFERLLDRV